MNSKNSSSISQKTAEKNIKIHGLINFISGILFLVPIISLFYKYSNLSFMEIVIISNVTTFCIWIFELPTSVFADITGRKKSMLYSVICNFLGAITILLFPTLTGFIIAAIFASLYWSFWSGTGQAFLEENLSIINKRHEFGRKIGSFMFFGELGTLITPLIASLILKIFHDTGYTILAFLDVVVGLILVFLVLRLTETTKIREKFSSLKEAWHEHILVAKTAITNVFRSAKLRTFLLYRSFSHHMEFLAILILPILSERGMPDWFAGFVATIGVIGSIFASKYAYLIGEKFGYNISWILGTVVQGILLIVIGLFIDSWIFVIGLFFIFNIFDGLWQPSWNHVLVELTNGKAIATTRSVIFSVFALYITIGKQVLSFISIEYALIILGIFILLINVLLGKRILNLTKN